MVEIFTKMYSPSFNFKPVWHKKEHLKTVFSAIFHAITINGNEALKLPKR